MVQAVDNRSRVRGVVEATAAYAAAPGHRLLRVRVDSAEAAPGFAHLLGEAAGEVIAVIVPDHAPALSPGAAFDAEVALARPGLARLVEAG